MNHNEHNLKKPRSAWEKPVLSVLDIDMSDVESSRNFGSDAGNGRTSSAS